MDAHQSHTQSPVIVSIGATPYACRISVGGEGGAAAHTLVADEPEAMGGADTGPIFLNANNAAGPESASATITLWPPCAAI